LPQMVSFFFVDKKDRKFRPVQDYHYLNLRTWTESQVVAFQDLKTVFSTGPILVYPDTMKPLQIEFLVIGIRVIRLLRMCNTSSTSKWKRRCITGITRCSN
jgi:hypothetical protein